MSTITPYQHVWGQDQRALLLCQQQQQQQQQQLRPVPNVESVGSIAVPCSDSQAQVLPVFDAAAALCFQGRGTIFAHWPLLGQSQGPIQLLQQNQQAERNANSAERNPRTCLHSQLPASPTAEAIRSTCVHQQQHRAGTRPPSMSPMPGTQPNLQPPPSPDRTVDVPSSTCASPEQPQPAPTHEASRPEGGFESIFEPDTETGMWELWMENAIRKYISEFRTSEMQYLKTQHAMEDRYLKAFFQINPTQNTSNNFFSQLTQFIRESLKTRQAQHDALADIVAAIEGVVPSDPGLHQNMIDLRDAYRSKLEGPKPAASPERQSPEAQGDGLRADAAAADIRTISEHTHDERILFYGSTAVKLAQTCANGPTHAWTLYVREGCGCRPGSVIRKVIFEVPRQHAATAPSREEPPFRVSGRGRADFEAQMTIFLRSPHCSDLHVQHTVRLRPPAQEWPGQNTDIERALDESCAARQAPAEGMLVHEFQQLVYIPRFEPVAGGSKPMVMPERRPTKRAKPGGQDEDELRRATPAKAKAKAKAKTKAKEVGIDRAMALWSLGVGPEEGAEEGGMAVMDILSNDDPWDAEALLPNALVFPFAGSSPGSSHSSSGGSPGPARGVHSEWPPM